jgi:hypothetical protein
MLRLPALRKELEDLNTVKQPMSGLFEAYEDASVTLERLRHDGRFEDAYLLPEYEAICSEIEGDVIAFYVRRFDSEPRGDLRGRCRDGLVTPLSRTLNAEGFVTDNGPRKPPP